jgi:gluconokinase|tara:strand:+ start:593 stop:802 length:210 start_codon:yes stop_codon:yes gene_type:complete
LDAEQELITERLTKRSGHFMSPQLLSSQIAEMEPFDNEIPLLKLDTADSPESLLGQLEQFMSLINSFAS